MTAIEDRTARDDLYVIAAAHYGEGEDADALIDAFKIEVLTEALVAIGGMVGQDPAIDNDTVMACHDELNRLIKATDAEQATEAGAVAS